jgi:hypothetical protein
MAAAFLWPSTRSAAARLSSRLALAVRCTGTAAVRMWSTTAISMTTTRRAPSRTTARSAIDIDRLRARLASLGSPSVTTSALTGGRRALPRYFTLASISLLGLVGKEIEFPPTQSANVNQVLAELDQAGRWITPLKNRAADTRATAIKSQRRTISRSLMSATTRTHRPSPTRTARPHRCRSVRPNMAILVRQLIV